MEYKDIFYHEQLPLTFTNEIKHEIRLSRYQPIYIKPYRKSPSQRDEINKYVNKMLEQNIVREPFSP